MREVLLAIYSARAVEKRVSDGEGNGGQGKALGGRGGEGRGGEEGGGEGKGVNDAWGIEGGCGVGTGRE